VLRKTPSHVIHRNPRTHAPITGGLPAFTLVELLVVIAIISILMTAGVIGLGGISGGKGVSSAVATAEALFDEARSIAVATAPARVLVSKALINNPQDNLRKIIVISAEVDPWQGKSPVGALQPRPCSAGTSFFSQDFSKRKHSRRRRVRSEMESPAR
jgi:prepilin-type N-terminal cleavage/methylation domain-containing protein